MSFRLSCLGDYHVFENFMSWRLSSLGNYRVLETSCLGDYPVLETVLSWRLSCLGDYRVSETIVSWRLSCLGDYPVLETIVTKIEITTLAAKLATIKDIHFEFSSDYFVLLHVVVYCMFVNITVLFS